MKNSVILSVVVLTSAASLAQSGEPCGALLCRTDLSAELAQRVLDIVADARTEDGSTFDAVARVRASVPELDASKRGRVAIVGPGLTKTGEGAVPAILERVVLADPGSETLSGSALTAWRIGLLEALGRLRDPRSAAVLEAVCRSPELEPQLLAAAAAALGRLETDAAAAVLVELSHTPGERGRAVLAGMGHCRRLAVVRRVAEALPEQRDAASHRAVVRSLATAASAPVWRAGLVRHPEEGAEIRALAAGALLHDFVGRSAAERGRIVTALLVVDEPSTQGRINDARSLADPGLLADLDHLARRLQANPVSRMSTPPVSGP
jgi:hypothetical protein